MFLRIGSTSFGDGERIPEKHARSHAILSPPLAWRGAPRETQSLVLGVEDEDAPHGTFHHSAVYDIPSGAPIWMKAPGGGARNSATTPTTTAARATTPPAPARGRHPSLPLPARRARCARSHHRTGRASQDGVANRGNHVLKQAELVGIYER